MGKGSMLGHSREKNPGRVLSLFSVRGNLDGFVRKRRSSRSVTTAAEGGRILNRRRMKSPLKAAAVSRTEPARRGQARFHSGSRKTVNTHW